MSKAANMEVLEALHAKLAEVITEGLNGTTDEDGNLKPPSPALITAALKFLKDNGVEAAKGSNNAALAALADRLKNLDPVQEAETVMNVKHYNGFN